MVSETKILTGHNFLDSLPVGGSIICPGNITGYHHLLYVITGSVEHAWLVYTNVFVPRHIKNISPNYPRDVLQMFDKRNMTITRRVDVPGPGVGRLQPCTGHLPSARSVQVSSSVPCHWLEMVLPVPVMFRGYPLNHCLRLVVSIVWLVKTNWKNIFILQRMQPFTSRNMKNYT